jgi:hypothetical protein
MFRTTFAWFLVWLVRGQAASGLRRVHRLDHWVKTLSNSKIIAELEKSNKVFADLCARARSFRADLEKNGGSAPPEAQEQLACRAAAIRHGLSEYQEERALLVASLSTYYECEVLPLQAEVDWLREWRSSLLQRLRFLQLWINGQTTAPALEVLLYFVVPVSHLEALLGDLQEEYQTIQVPRSGPRAAQWWYTKHVLKTIVCYATWALKRASIVISGARTLYRIVHWLGRLFL